MFKRMSNHSNKNFLYKMKKLFSTGGEKFDYDVCVIGGGPAGNKIFDI